MIADGLFDHLVERRLKVRSIFQTIRVDLQRLRDRRVEHDVRAGDTVGGTEHPELKLVAGESKRRRPVAVRRIFREFRQYVHAELHQRFFGRVVRLVAFDGLEDGGQFIAQKNRNDGRRRFVRAQSVVVARGCHGKPQKILIVIDRFQDRAQEQQELRVFVRRIARRQQICAFVGGDGPVVVLAAAVDAGERFFVQQAD